MKKIIIYLFLLFIGIENSNAQDSIQFEYGSNFCAEPQGSLIRSGATLYGCAEAGFTAYGSVFAIDTSGNNLRILHNFNYTYGSLPSSLILLGKTLYGVAMGGGIWGYGCVFSVDTNGSRYRDLFDFLAGEDAPVGPLVIAGQTIYGITSEGNGLIYAMDTDGTRRRIIMSFNGTNGKFPFNPLTISGKKLYGMTSAGGGSPLLGNIFSVDTDGNEFQVLHNFNGTDGAGPEFCQLLLVGGKLYGAAENGGTSNYGTLFSIDTNGTHFSVIYNFNGTDGWFPQEGLIISGSLLYGTSNGGIYNHGLLYCVDTNGNGFKHLIDFNNTDGGGPSGVLKINNSLYGVTQGGSTANWGVIYKFLNNFAVSCKATKNVSCAGGSDGIATALVNGGSAPYSYLWSDANAQTSMSATGLSIGTYTVTARDSAGTSLTASVNIVLSPLIVSTGTKRISCHGGSNGIATASVTGGGAPYTYIWSDPNSQTNKSATGLSLGTYTVTVMDSCGATANAFATITEPPALNDSASVVNVSCYGHYNGLAESHATGGTLPYTYLWNTTPAQNYATATGLGPGSYTVTVTDSCGSSVTASVTITQPNPLTVTHDSVPSDSTCDGIAAVYPAGGTPPYTYFWTPGGLTTDSITWQCAGTYTCYVTDANNCYLTTTVTINCANDYNEPICILTIDTTNNKSKVIWGRTNSPPPDGYGSYNVYKYNGTNYALLHSQPLDSLSEYVDTSSNPSIATQSYELSTTDSCGESALSPPHTSILLTTTASTNAFNLSWTPYIGFTPVRYRIFRGPSMSNLTQIDSVANTVFSYVDSFPPPNVYYVLEAVNPGTTCTPSTQRLARLYPTPFLSGSFSNGFNTAILGINNIAQNVNTINVYPNPANDIINIQMSHPVDGTISINNVLGQQVYEGKLSNANKTTQVSIGGLSQGVYLLKIESEEQTVVKRIVKL